MQAEALMPGVRAEATYAEQGERTVKGAVVKVAAAWKLLHFWPNPGEGVSVKSHSDVCLPSSSSYFPPQVR